MDKILEYVELIGKDSDITFKLEYSSHRGWYIKLHEKGYDMPLFEIRKKRLKDFAGIYVEFLVKCENYRRTKYWK